MQRQLGCHVYAVDIIKTAESIQPNLCHYASIKVASYASGKVVSACERELWGLPPLNMTSYETSIWPIAGENKPCRAPIWTGFYSLPNCVRVMSLQHTVQLPYIKIWKKYSSENFNASFRLYVHDTLCAFRAWNFFFFINIIKNE